MKQAICFVVALSGVISFSSGKSMFSLQGKVSAADGKAVANVIGLTGNCKDRIAQTRSIKSQADGSFSISGLDWEVCSDALKEGKG